MQIRKKRLGKNTLTSKNHNTCANQPAKNEEHKNHGMNKQIEHRVNQPENRKQM